MLGNIAEYQDNPFWRGGSGFNDIESEVHIDGSTVFRGQFDGFREPLTSLGYFFDQLVEAVSGHSLVSPLFELGFVDRTQFKEC